MRSILTVGAPSCGLRSWAEGQGKKSPEAWQGSLLPPDLPRCDQAASHSCCHRHSHCPATATTICLCFSASSPWCAVPPPTLCQNKSLFQVVSCKGFGHNGEESNRHGCGLFRHIVAAVSFIATGGHTLYPFCFTDKKTKAQKN